MFDWFVWFDRTPSTGAGLPRTPPRIVSKVERSIHISSFLVFGKFKGFELSVQFASLMSLVVLDASFGLPTS